MLTTKEVCARLHISRHTVQWLREYGLLHMAWLGAGYVTTEAEVERFESWLIGKRVTNKDSVRRYAEEERRAGSRQTGTPIER